MKLVMTLLVRDEEDVLREHLEYHLNAGVDHVVAIDHRSQDGSTEILDSYARQGVLTHTREEGTFSQQGEWQTRMSRLAVAEHGADWVVPSDADEFWMPRGGTLREVLDSVPTTHGVVFALSRHFVPRPDDNRPFSERMTVRVAPPAAIHDPTSPYRPHLKAAHRGDPAVTISFGAHTVASPRWRALHNWHPADVLHFPFRSLVQWEQKGSRRARGDKPLGQYVTALRALESGRSAERYLALVVDDALLEQGLSTGSLRVDTRLCDALRALRSGAPESDDAAPDTRSVVSDSVAVRDADIVRLRRHLDRVAVRVGTLEAH